MLLRCRSAVAKKRSIALHVLLAVRTATIQADVDMVAGDFNGASWRHKTGSEQQVDSTLEEAFKKKKTPGSMCLFALSTVVGPWWYSE